PHRTELYQDFPSTCWPIVYSRDYNITFMGLEKLHPFDAGKWGKVITFLKESKLITDDSIVQAREATEEDLLVVHTRQYLNRLKVGYLLFKHILESFEEAGKLAIERGWAINVAPSILVQYIIQLCCIFSLQGGGFHHCSSDKGGGFCAYADISLTIKFLFERIEGVCRATIIDLDAHQDRRVYIMDVYNRYIYPGDGFAKRAIQRKVELEWGTEDTEYLQKVKTHVEGALNEVKSDIIIYNAGTDILDGDPLGGLAISPQGIIDRDEIVFRAARKHRVPILMVTSGGYQKRTARIIADSLLNLHSLGLIDKDLATGETGSTKVETSREQ
ncbi:hypothetical protein JD844_013328, partial [Phrynosoma platyrhinos]